MASFLFFFVHHIGEVNKGPRGMDHEPEGISVGVQGNEIRLTGQVFDVIGDPYSNLLCPLKILLLSLPSSISASRLFFHPTIVIKANAFSSGSITTAIF